VKLKRQKKMDGERIEIEYYESLPQYIKDNIDKRDVKNNTLCQSVYSYILKSKS
jgi:hypothetical protein